MEHLNVDLKKIAASTGPKGSGIPEPVAEMARYWLKLSDGHLPRWSEFRMSQVTNATPHLTVLHKLEEGRYAFEFCGSAVASLLGQDLTGVTMSDDDGTRGEIDWAERMRSVLADGGAHMIKGTAEPQYTPSIDFLALDVPLRTEDGDGIGYVVGCTVPKIN